MMRARTSSRSKGPVAPAFPPTYIFDTLQGTIEGYSPGSFGGSSSAEIVVTNNPSTTEYTGLAAGTFRGKHYIYAANDAPGRGIEVYNDSFERATLPGKFVDPHLPRGLRPMASMTSGPTTNSCTSRIEAPTGVGGAVAEFTNGGTFVEQIAYDTTTSGYLQSPWGMDQAPESFGKFSNDILVGNFSTGQIDAYNFRGTIQGTA